MDHAIVSREQWLDARKALLAKERAMTHALDALRAERRALPWVTVEKDYVFAGPDGDVTLGDLFDGRSQLAIYHFMLAPGRTTSAPAARSPSTTSTRRAGTSSTPTSPSPRCRGRRSRRSRR